MYTKGQIPYNKGVPKDKTPQEFLSSRSVLDSSGCILWTKSIGANGSGTIGDRYWGIKYKVQTPYQLAYVLHYGDYDRTLIICHKCNNRNCLNPVHLYAGTHKENTADMFRAHRQPNRHGYYATNRILDESQVLEIKKLLLEGTLLQREIAAMYEVDRITINDIHNKRTWKHL